MIVKDIFKAYNRINKYIVNTSLQYSERLSKKYNANIFLKREDLQNTRSFKLRGSLNKILINKDNNKNTRIITASAGNHAQGVAFSSGMLNIPSKIYCPTYTPLQKINRINNINKHSELIIYGDTFNKTLGEAINNSKEDNSKKNNIFIHPYDDYDVICGQGTIAKEINESINPDMLICPIGGGGLISGIGSFFKNINNNNNVQIYGVESQNNDAMNKSILAGKRIYLENIDTFVDGTSVSYVGDLTFNICKKILDDIFIINNNRLCNEIINLYQEDGIIVEPAGALSVCGLDFINKGNIKGKNIVCILSGGNNDLMRYPEIMESNLNYLNRKHYYIIKFNQKPGELKRFIDNILSVNDDITRFEYLKKTNKHSGSVLIGIESNNPHVIDQKLKSNKFIFNKITSEDILYNYLI